VGTVIPIERVVARWRRAPAMLFVCDSGRSARAGDAAHPIVSHEPHGGDA